MVEHSLTLLPEDIQDMTLLDDEAETETKDSTRVTHHDFTASILAEAGEGLSTSELHTKIREKGRNITPAKVASIITRLRHSGRIEKVNRKWRVIIEQDDEDETT
jgi:Fe2+ or Zn2+ uptake regulation protein